MATVTTEYIIGAVTVTVIYVVVASRVSIRGRPRKFIGHHKLFAAMIQMMAFDLWVGARLCEGFRRLPYFFPGGDERSERVNGME